MTLKKSEMLAKSTNREDLYLINENILDREKVFAKCEKYVNNKELLEVQSDILKKYYLDLKSRRTTLKSAKSILNIVLHLYRLGNSIKKPFSNYTKDDIICYFGNLLNARTEEKKELALSTITHKNVVFKQFFKWLYQTDDYPEVIRHLETGRMHKEMDQSELLTWAEINSMVGLAGNLRDKTLIIGLYESGCRASELLGIKIKDIKFTDNYVEVVVNGKTGKRHMTLVYSEPYIRKLINEHPYNSCLEAPLFINLSKGFYGRQLLLQGLQTTTKTLAKRAKIHKRIYPHLFRHSRATELASSGWTEKELRLYFGWSMSSKTPEIYVNFGQGHVKNKILEMHGLLNKSNEVNLESKKLEPKKCPRCGNNNPGTSLYCNCGMALDVRTAMKIHETKIKADLFTEELMTKPLPENIDLKHGMMEALFQAMVNDKEMLEKFKTLVNSKLANTT